MATGFGHSGVGWRESNTALLAIYTLEDGALAPKASYAVDRTIGGLISATVQQGAPLIGAH